MKLRIPLLLPLSFALSMFTSTAFAELDHKECVAKLKDTGKETPMNVKKHTKFVDDLCSCMIKSAENHDALTGGTDGTSGDIEDKKSSADDEEDGDESADDSSEESSEESSDDSSDNSMVSKEIFAQCTSRLLVINTIREAPDQEPKDVDAVKSQCLSTALENTGSKGDSTDDEDLNKYCDCVAPKVFKLYSSKENTDVLAQKILKVGDQCTSVIEKSMK